ncbi:MAG: hydroxyproline-2-epimerase [Planctomycetes bacterium]|nr:hydroxyproline-2-epimerase [Planctomycetota bacterium]
MPDTLTATDLLPARLRVIDSHTLGEPTRLVCDEHVAAALTLGAGSVRSRRDVFRTRHDPLRLAIVGDPRGAEAMVGVLTMPAAEPDCALGAFYFNRVGYLDMCGHATIGLAVSLGHLGRIAPGRFDLETPAGVVGVEWHGGTAASFSCRPPRRLHRGLAVHAGDGSVVTGDVATSGLWFFITADHGLPVAPAAIPLLLDKARAIRRGLDVADIRGDAGEAIDHVVLLGPPHDHANDARNFVLCPDGAFDRSPCGTATSALVGCLHEDGKLPAGAVWRQESILGGLYEATIRRVGDAVVPTVRGHAWISAESTLCFSADDPYRTGIADLPER